MPNVIHVEGARALVATVDFAAPQKNSVTTSEFVGGRVHHQDGSNDIFSGLPAGDWELSLPDGIELPAPSVALAAVRRFAAPLAKGANLQYLEKLSVRLVVGTSLLPHRTVRHVWALTGQVAVHNGGVVSIGESGRGSGLPYLEAESWREALLWKLGAIAAAEPTPSGKVRALLACPAAALLLHEAIGHFVEADEEFDLRHRLGARIGSEIFEVWDDPLAPGGPANYTLDDEGVASLSPTMLVREGRLIGMVHSLASAARSRSFVTGNGRAASGWNKPIPRISNLVCSPGGKSRDELLDEVGTGLYIHSLADGFGCGDRVQARIRLAELTERGRRTGRFVTGGLIDEDRFVLTRAAGIGDESVFYHNSMCGKARQLLYDVGTCSPSIVVSDLRILA